MNSTVLNPDRGCANPNLLYRGQDSLLLIDHSLALPAHGWLDRQIGISPVFEDSNIQKHCGYPLLKGKKREYKERFEKWESGTTDSDLDQLRSFIPKSWQ
jgi:hypothetical protein